MTILSLMLPTIVTGLMLAVIYLDGRYYRIPNWITVLLFALYPLHLWLSPEPIDWLVSLGIAAIVLIIGFMLFALKAFGAGDAKLLCGCALWAGSEHILMLIFFTALFGGALALALVIGRSYLALAMPWVQDHPQCPNLIKPAKPMPYGIAIAFGMMMVLWH